MSVCTRCYVWHRICCPGLTERIGGGRSSLQLCSSTHLDTNGHCLDHPVVFTKHPATYKLVRTVIYQPFSGGAQVCHHKYELCGPCAFSSVISCERPDCYECVAFFFFFCGQGKENSTSREYLWRMTTKKVFSGIRYIFIPLKCVYPFLSCSTCSVLETANQTTNLALFLNCNQSHKAEQGRITSKPASSSHLLWTFAASCFTVPILPHNHILFLQGIILSFRNCRSHPKAIFPEGST